MDDKHKELNENVHTYDNGFHPKEVHLKENYKLYRKGIFFKIFNKIIIYLFKFLLFFPKKFVWGFKVIGKKNKKYIKSSTLVCNHTHQFDAFMILTALPTKRIYVTMLESNLGFGIISGLFRAGGAVPIPNDINLLKRFNKETPEVIKEGYNILVYPEAALMPYCDHIRKFLNGAFHYSFEANGKIIPSVITYHKPKGIYKLTRRNKPCIHYNILEPYYIKDLGNKRLTLQTATNDVNKIMSDYFNEHSDYFK
ncbi:MAG: lysophospholipid acyltransferase family protein [Anaeroplasma sp.]